GGHAARHRRVLALRLVRYALKPVVEVTGLSVDRALVAGLLAADTGWILPGVLQLSHALLVSSLARIVGGLVGCESLAWPVLREAVSESNAVPHHHRHAPGLTVAQHIIIIGEVFVHVRALSHGGLLWLRVAHEMRRDADVERGERGDDGALHVAVVQAVGKAAQAGIDCVQERVACSERQQRRCAPQLARLRSGEGAFHVWPPLRRRAASTRARCRASVMCWGSSASDSGFNDTGWP